MTNESISAIISFVVERNGIKSDIAELCKGSTSDSDSLCSGSNPDSAAKKTSISKSMFFFIAVRCFFINLIQKTEAHRGSWYASVFFWGGFHTYMEVYEKKDGIGCHTAGWPISSPIK